MVDSQLLAFTGIAFLLTITPGADTMLVLRSVLSRGQRAGLLTILGISSGLFIHATLSAIGLSVILVRSATAFEIVKMAGAAYLLFLGIQSLWRALRSQTHPTDPQSLAPTTARRACLEGLFTNVLNPKVAIFYLAFLPQFIAPGNPVFLKSILLASIHVILGMIWLSLITVMLGQMRAALTRPHVQRALEGLTGMVFLGFGVRLALESSS